MLRSGVLCLFLFAMMFGACQPDVNEIPTPAIKANPIHDTLWTLQRTSYRVPDHISDRTKVQMFVGTQSVAADLIYDGELFFMTPEDSGSWSVRVYYDGVLQDFEVKTLTLRGRKSGPDPWPHLNQEIVYVGQTVAIPIAKDITRSKINVFIDDTEIGIDSMRHDDFTGWSYIDVIYFRHPKAGDSIKMVVRVDSAAFVWDRISVADKPGEFLKQRAARQLEVIFSGLAATGVIYYRVDTGLQRHPQPTAQSAFLSMPFDDMPTTWSGDTLVIDFSRSQNEKQEKFYMRLLPDKLLNIVSGFVEYERSGDDSVYFYVDVHNAFWRWQQGAYWIGAKDFEVSAAFRNLRYFRRSASGFYEVESYRGGTSGSNFQIVIDPIQ
jgi:hypothetical protein